MSLNAMYECAMKIRILSQEDMKDLINNEKIPLNAAIISFYNITPCYENDYEGAIDFTGKCGRVMTIPLDDIEINELERHGYTYRSFFPQVDKLAEFIYSAMDDDCEILCQCVFGMSRSAGCAAAILQHFKKRGIDIFADEKYYPNRLVYKKVFDALNKYRRKHETL